MSSLFKIPEKGHGHMKKNYNTHAKKHDDKKKVCGHILKIINKGERVSNKGVPYASTYHTRAQF